MRYIVDFTKQARKELQKLKSSNPALYSKADAILKELMSHPRQGTGHPEALRGYGGVLWSRRLSKKDRLVYEIHDDTVIVIVLTVVGHYEDK